MYWQIFAALILLCLARQTLANESLLGRWQVVYEYEGQQMTVLYRIRQLGPVLQGVLEPTDDSKELKLSIENAIVLDQIHFQHNTGTGLYQLNFKGDVSQLPATLTLVDANTLKVEYAYFGFKESETWTRIAPQQSH